MNKEELRAVYRQIRLRMSKSEVAAKSRMIGRKLLNEVEWDRYDTISIFQPLGSLNEVDISGVTSRLKAQGKQITVLAQGKNAAIPVEMFDLIVVPCLAFDKNNYRLGWGGGFYDKFLAAQPAAKKIGVGFQNSYTEELPHEAHDIKLDAVFTEA